MGDAGDEGDGVSAVMQKKILANFVIRWLVLLRDFNATLI
jgi:hypothetical protein